MEGHKDIASGFPKESFRPAEPRIPVRAPPEAENDDSKNGIIGLGLWLKW
jgi:hypothetical protein